jgi:HPt (histidine-containing phosphotransfer) domain-containing protein
MRPSARPVGHRPSLALPALLAALLVLAAVGCDRSERIAPGAATEPVQAVALLSRHLRNNDLQAFARDAVPPELLPPLAAAWQAGSTRWPLDELPFDQKIPGIVTTLSADQADVQLRRSFDRQFANANTEIHAAATALGLFGVKFLQSDDTLSAEERAHYAQLVSAMSEWGASASLGDPKRGRSAIARLTLAARQTGLREEADFRRFGMDDSLRRLTPLIAALKETLRSHDLDLDQSLDTMTLSLAGKAIDTSVAVERIDGHWYLSDFLRHARAAALVPDAAPAAMPSVLPSTETATKQPPSS